MHIDKFHHTASDELCPDPSGVFHGLGNSAIALLSALGGARLRYGANLVLGLGRRRLVCGEAQFPKIATVVDRRSASKNLLFPIR